MSNSSTHPGVRIHASAVVDDPCEIGPGTAIWHFCHVMDGCRLGRDCNLGQNVFVARGVRIGNGVKIQNNVSVYAGVELEDDVFIGPSAVFTNVNTPRAHVDRKAVYDVTRVRRGATIGANATVVTGNAIGSFAFVGAGAVVTSDVRSHALVVGNPARQVGWMCSCGERIRELVCERCTNTYAEENGELVLVSNGAENEADEVEK